MGDESHERVRDLAVSVRSAGGRACRGSILNGGAESVDTQFPRECAPMLPLGQPTTLTFLDGDAERCEVRARARYRHDTDGFRRYSFDFDTTPELHDVLTRLFNIRGAFRVPADPLVPVRVRMVSPSGITAQGELRSISASGLGMVTAAQVERDFAAVEEVQLLFTLTSATGELRIAARIRNRELHGGRIQYGLEFEREHTVQPPEHEQFVLAYVMERQRRMLGAV
jgi:hypothetical protein